MNRSSLRPRRRRSGSRTSARVTGWTAPTAAAIPGGENRVSDGLVIQAHVTARLLGIRLLRVEADVIVSPADTRARSTTVAVGAPTRATRPRSVGARLV